MSRHPGEAGLALYAGGELGRWRRWHIERHLVSCAECRRDVSDFSALRAETRALSELPELSWGPMAAEMRANIRLGLQAGECVSRPTASPTRFNWRVLAACASLAALLVVSLLIERPARPVAESQPPEVAVLETSGSGIQVTEGEQTMMLLNERAQRSGTKGGKDVNYLATGGTLRARYVDAETGYVTINNVYVQ